MTRTTMQRIVELVMLHVDHRREPFNDRIAELDPHSARVLAGTAVALYAEALALRCKLDGVPLRDYLRDLGHAVAWDAEEAVE